MQYIDRFLCHDIVSEKLKDTTGCKGCPTASDTGSGRSLVASHQELLDHFKGKSFIKIIMLDNDMNL